MPESQRTGTWPRPDEWPKDEKGTCPGYLISLPAVIEVAGLYRWYETGQLALRLEGLRPTAVLMVYIDVFGGALRSVESWAIAEAGRREPQGHHR